MKTLKELFPALSGYFDLLNSAIVNKWVQALLVLLVAFFLSRQLQSIVKGRLSHGDKSDDDTIQTYKNVARFVVMVPGILLAIHVLGVNVSSVFTTSGLFAVALAFAMKNIAENYISGMMIRVERSIKPGDVLEVQGKMVRVEKIGFRDTIARSKEEKDILIPNSHLIQEQISNYTLKDPICRVWTFVGVSYSSDIKKVREVLEGICDSFEGLSDQHAPEVLLTDFGDSSVNYKISVWIEDPWKSGVVKSRLNEAIWEGLCEADIEIAFPQLDVHFDNTFRQEEVGR